MPRKALPVPQSLFSNIVVHVQNNPGCKSSDIFDALGGTKPVFNKAMKMLRESGALRMEGSRRTATYFRGDGSMPEAVVPKVEAKDAIKRKPPQAAGESSIESAAAVNPKTTTKPKAEPQITFESAEELVEYAINNKLKILYDYTINEIVNPVVALGDGQFSRNEIAKIIMRRAKVGNRINYRHVYQDRYRIAYNVLPKHED